MPLNFLKAVFTFWKLLKKSCSRVYKVTMSMPSWLRNCAAYACVERLFIFLKLKFSVMSSLNPSVLTDICSYRPVPVSLPDAPTFF